MSETAVTPATTGCLADDYRAAAPEKRRGLRVNGVVFGPCGKCGGELAVFDDPRAAFGCFRVECHGCGDFFDQQLGGGAPPGGDVSVAAEPMLPLSDALLAAQAAAKAGG